MPKSNNAEIEARVTQVYNLLAVGADRPEICQYASQHWGVSDRQAGRYIQRANEKFAEEGQAERTVERGKARKRLNELYKSLLRIQDYKGALNVQRELNKLYALYDPQQHDVTVRDWRTEVIALLKEGVVTPAQVEAEIGNSLAEELFKSIGLTITPS